MQPQEEIIFLVEEDAEGGYTAQALGSQQSIFTQGDDFEELKEMTAEDDKPQVISAHCKKF